MTDLQDSILIHARKEYPRESCGLIVANGNDITYKPCRNIATGNEHFALHPEDYASVKGEIKAIVHSHVDVPPTPSELDIKACNQSNTPWWIISTETGELHKFLPENKKSLVGREWCYPMWDCFRLVQDYYEQLGITLPDFERGDLEWCRSGGNKVEENISYAGFKQVKLDEIKVGDLLLFSIKSKVSNHIGIYCGDNLMLHQAYGQLSRREPLNEAYLKRLTMVLRYSL